MGRKERLTTVAMGVPGGESKETAEEDDEEGGGT